MTLAAVVQHVQVLEAAGLVSTQKVGRVRTVQVDPDGGLRSAAAWLAERRTRVERQLDRLAGVLGEPTAGPSDTRRSDTDQSTTPQSNSEQE
jgi:DNA-binding transcriptional ArsR family regulator